MGYAVVITLNGAADLLIGGIMAAGSVSEFVAVAMIAHIAVYVSVVMACVDVYGMSVTGRIMSPVPG